MNSPVDETFDEKEAEEDLAEIWRYRLFVYLEIWWDLHIIIVFLGLCLVYLLAIAAMIPGNFSGPGNVNCHPSLVESDAFTDCFSVFMFPQSTFTCATVIPKWNKFEASWSSTTGSCWPTALWRRAHSKGRNSRLISQVMFLLWMISVGQGFWFIVYSDLWRISKMKHEA